MALDKKSFDLLVTEVADLAADFGVAQDPSFGPRVRDMVANWIDRQTKELGAELDRQRVANEGLTAQRDDWSARHGKALAERDGAQRLADEWAVKYGEIRAQLDDALAQVAASSAQLAEAADRHVDELDRLESEVEEIGEVLAAAQASARRRATYVIQWRDKFRAMRDERDQASRYAAEALLRADANGAEVIRLRLRAELAAKPAQPPTSCGPRCAAHGVKGDGTYADVVREAAEDAAEDAADRYADRG